MPHPSLSLPVLGLAEAAAILREAVYSVVPIGQGARSRVYRVETEDGAVRVVRLTPKGTGRVAREAWVRARLRRHPDVPLLAEIAVQDVPLADVAEVVTMAELPGTTMFAASRTLFEPEVRELYAQLGRALAALHAVEVQGYGLIDSAGAGPYPTWRAAFEATARAGLAEAAVSPLAGLVPAATAAIDTLLASALEPAPAARLLHGDAQPMNVQVHRGRIVALFDFEFASGGDPAYELAYLDPLFEPSHAQTVTPDDLAARRAAFYTAYTARGAPAAVPPERVRLYRLVHALRTSEFLSVVGPQLSAPVRDQTTLALRAGLARWL